MNQDLHRYIETARGKGLDEREIFDRLHNVGWDAQEVYAALEVDQELVPPAPRSRRRAESEHERTGEGSLSVVSSGFSGNGFEYLIYFLALGIVALAVGSMLHNIVNVLIATDKFSFYRDTIPYSTAVLTVVGPVYLWLMLRLRKKEISSPSILKDPSRRRAVQFLLLVTFLVGIIKLVAYAFNLIDIAGGGGSSQSSILAETLHAAITIGIAGGIFLKYFREQSSNELS